MALEQWVQMNIKLAMAQEQWILVWVKFVSALKY
jgi:hypothetical protein